MLVSSLVCTCSSQALCHNERLIRFAEVACIAIENALTGVVKSHKAIGDF